MGTVAVTVWLRPTGGTVPTGGLGREDTRGRPPWCASSALRWPAIIHACVLDLESTGQQGHHVGSVVRQMLGGG